MKWQAIIVLLAITFSIFVAPSMPLTAYHGRQVAIGTLDICHSSDPVLSVNGHMPVLNQSPFVVLPLVLNTVSTNKNSPLRIFFVASPDERPPQA